ncbi:MAG: hypothetical protein GDA55_00225 [Cellvibrionales bacterium]|nr:hypothetical protein [Cellvibrionales bacterium]
MPISETDIRQWADHQECRNNLPILIRRLIRETVSRNSLISLRFPGNEAVDLSGIDGQAECKVGTLWVPEGVSFWEMGCEQKPAVKANKDYKKRVETLQDEQENTSFVFVTPRKVAR